MRRDRFGFMKILAYVLAAVFFAAGLVGCQAAEQTAELPAPSAQETDNTRQPAPEEVEEDVVALVNGVEIRNDDLTRNLLAYMSSFGLSAEAAEENPELISQLKEAVLEEHIQLELVRQKAEQAGITVSEEKRKEYEQQADAYLASLVESYREAAQQKVAEDSTLVLEEEMQRMADEYMEAYGTTRQDLIDEAVDFEMEQQLKAQLTKEIQPTEQQIESYYNANYGNQEDPQPMEQVREQCEQGALATAQNEEWSKLIKQWKEEAEIFRYLEHLS